MSHNEEGAFVAGFILGASVILVIIFLIYVADHVRIAWR